MEEERPLSCDMSAQPKPGYRPCVGLFLLNRDNRVFAAQRNDVGAAAWQMPQGGIDPGETPIVAGLREMEEEIGTRRARLLQESGCWRSYDLPGELGRRMWGGRFVGQTQKWLALRFEGEDAEIDLEVEHPEFRAWQWVDPDRLSALIVPFKREIYASVVAEFRPLWA